MRILMVISDNTFPPDIRVEKEIKTLLDSGHDIGVIALRWKGQAERDRWQGVDIWRIRIPLREVPKLGRFMELALLRHLKVWEIERIAREFKPDVIHAHDLPLATPAMKVARRLGVPLVVDFHEHYPAMMLDRLPPLLARMVVPILYREERRIVHAARAIITVVDENTERIKKEYGVENVYTVENGVDIDKLREIEDRVGKNEIKYDFCYVGGLNHARGLETVVMGLSEVKGDVRTVFVGDGPLRGKLQSMARDYGVDIEFTGHLPFEKAMSIAIASRFGLVPHDSTLHMEHTVPHKLFQYMALGKPVIVSDVRPLRRIVQDCDCGLVFHASDAEDFASIAAKAITMDQSEWNEMSQRAKHCAYEKHSWAMAGRKLQEIYSAIEEGMR